MLASVYSLILHNGMQHKVTNEQIIVAVICPFVLIMRTYFIFYVCIVTEISITCKDVRLRLLMSHFLAWGRYNGRTYQRTIFHVVSGI
jgi:hypothetical protein